MKKLIAIFVTLILALVAIPSSVFANEGGKSLNTQFTRLELQNDNGGTIKEISVGSSFRLFADYSINDTVHTGDYFDMTVPSEVDLSSAFTNYNFTLNDSQGEVIANATIKPSNNGGGTVHVVFNEKVNNKSNLKGNLFFYARGNAKGVKLGEVTPIKITINNSNANSYSVAPPVKFTPNKPVSGTEVIGKWANPSKSKDRADWRIRINKSGQDLKNVVITDKIKSGNGEYLPEFKLQKVTFAEAGNITSYGEEVDVTNKIKYNSDNSTIDLYVNDKHTIKLEPDEQDKLKILKVDDIKIPENNITFGVTSNNAEVIKNSDDLLNYVKNKVVNKPQNIIAHIPVEKINLDNIYSFLTFSINTGTIMYGEHFRFVYTTIQENDNKTHYHIVDVIASNNDMYKTTANNVSLYPMYNNIEDYENDETKITDADGNEMLQDGWYRKNLIPFNIGKLQDKTIHYTAVCYYSQDLNDPTVQAPLNTQFQRIQAALSICGHDIHVSSYSDNTIAFISNSISDIEFIHMYHGQEIIQNNKVYNYNINYEDYSTDFSSNNIGTGYTDITYDILFKYILPGLLIQSKKDLKFSVPCRFITKTQCKPFKLYQTTQNLDKLLYNIQAPLIYTQKGYELISFIKHMLVKDQDIIKFYYYPSPIDTSKYMFMTLTYIQMYLQEMDNNKI